jgi:hypothetical protein
MADDIGTIKSINQSSMALNTQKEQGAMKPPLSGGNHNPGDTCPGYGKEEHVPMPK